MLLGPPTSNSGDDPLGPAYLDEGIYASTNVLSGVDG